MAKGQLRSNREAKKPKADKTVVKVAGTPKFPAAPKPSSAKSADK